jgi:hypothetical protein
VSVFLIFIVQAKATYVGQVLQKYLDRVGEQAYLSERTIAPMNGTTSGNMPMGETPAPAFRNRSTGLTVFGILTIGLGCISGLMALMMLAATAIAAHVPNAQPQPASGIAFVVLIYGGLAVALVWLGIGSIMGRRWARALILIFSWAWLVMGIIMMISMAFVLPKVWENTPGPNGQPVMPPGAVATATILMELFFGVFFVLLPAVWIFFYANHRTQATCEMRDPVRRWTDACPLPVLGLCLWLALSVPMMMLLPVLYHGVVPFFGLLLHGVAGSLLCLAVAALWAYCAWRLYKMDVRGWWLALIGMLLYGASSVMTFARHDMVEMYQAMGYTQAQIDQIQKTGLFTGNSMVWMMLVFFAPFLGYIVYVKQYLTAKE